MAAAVFMDGFIRNEAMGLAISSPYQAFADLLRVLEKSVGTMAECSNGDIVDPSWLVWWSPLAWKVTQVYKQHKAEQKAVATEQASINEVQNGQVAQWEAEWAPVAYEVGHKSP
jgi:hypothetical protein